MDDYGGMNLKTAIKDLKRQSLCAKLKSGTSQPCSSILGAFLTSALLIGSTSTFAEELLLEAITDFPIINAGEIPYYIDRIEDRNVLAINAAIEEYRDLFARAVTSFDGSSGVYDVTITALGEIDGEGEFRFLVNGELQGSAVNQLVTEDWGEQHHVFENIELEAGDEIAVESNARSNGLIPENGEYAFARGRWRSLGLVLDDEATGITEVADLGIVLEGAETQLLVGDSTGINLVIDNTVDSGVATGITIDVDLGPTLGFVSAEGCTIDSGDSAIISCDIAELAPGASSMIYLVVNAIDSGLGGVLASVSSSQTDPQSDNNSTELSFVVEPMANSSVVSQPSTPAVIDVEIDNETVSENSSELGVASSQANSESTVSSSGSGGGGAIWWLIAILAVPLFGRLKKLSFKSV